MCELEKQTSIRQTDANHLTRSKQTQWPNECPNLQLSVQLVSSPFKRVGRLVDPRVPSASEVRDRLPPLRVDGTILKCLLGLDLHQSQDVLQDTRHHKTKQLFSTERTKIANIFDLSNPRGIHRPIKPSCSIN